MLDARPAAAMEKRMKNRWAAFAAAVLCAAGALSAGAARAQTSAPMNAAAGIGDAGMIVIHGNGESAAQASTNVAGANVIVVAPPGNANATGEPAARNNPQTPAATPAARNNPQAPAATSAAQDPEAIRALATDFLRQQTAGLPGKVDVTVAQPFARGLAPCTNLTPFLPPGARLWGRTTVGVRCTGTKAWTLYLQARIALAGTYYVAARTIAPGATLAATDLVARDGDLAALPQAIVTDPSQAIGATATARITAGLPLRQDLLRSANAVQAGQSVKLVAEGQGFSVSAEGSALSSASAGQPVRVKTAGGQIVSGVVRSDGAVEIRL
jgi:flagella basal body P-ring formation protein FlgA